MRLLCLFSNSIAVSNNLKTYKMKEEKSKNELQNTLVNQGLITENELEENKAREAILAKACSRPISYFGGKEKMADFIMSHFPTDKKYRVYVETFSGAFGLFYTGNMSQFEEIIYNDYNPHVTNLVSCFQRPEEFRAVFNQYCEEGKDLYFDKTQTKEERGAYFRIIYACWKEELEPLTHEAIGLFNFDIAVRYYFLHAFPFSGCSPFGGGGFIYWENTTNTGTKYHRILKKLNDKDFIAKTQCITHFKCSDFEDIINEYNQEDVLLFQDPPYFGYEKKYNSGDFGLKGHIRLAKATKRFKGAMLMTYYNFSGFDMLYPKSHYNHFNYLFDSPSANKSGEHGMGNELLITNY